MDVASVASWVRKGVGMRNNWFWLSVVALVVGIAYILVAHPLVIGAIAVVVVSVALCVVSWMLGSQG
ncbi:MAG: hypothetical protein ACYDER_11845 [Ktedonobacteraceae bacterium]